MDRKKLFEQINIGTISLRNRIVMPAMGSGFGNEDGTVSDRMINYYKRRAEGGVALIITELTSIDPLGNSAPNCLRIYDDKYIPRLTRLTEQVKQYGTRIAFQLNHAGRQTLPQVIGAQLVSSSPVPAPLRPEPRALTVPEIEALIGAFIRGAKRAKEAGADAVELHCAHGYLIWQFLSPLCNKRTDEYGGDIVNRMRFAEEIIKGIKREVGSDFPVITRVSGSDFIEGGLTLEEAVIIAEQFERAGINALHVSGGSFVCPHWMIQPMLMPRGCLVHLAEAIHRKINIPVITVGRINDPDYAESILQEGKADLVAMGRALLTDPDFPKKAMNGQIEDIRRCVACNTCIGERLRGRSLSCAINPELGQEGGTGADFIKKADRPRKVMVVGGGPGGLEAARVARLRGHEVTLLEAKDELGGQLSLATRASYKEELKAVVPYYKTQLEKLGVKVELGTKASPSNIGKLSPDVVVIATGAVPLIPDIPGIRQGNVCTAWDVLEGKVKLSGKVLIIGGGSVGCETADVLHQQKLKVSIAEMLEDIGTDMEPFVKNLIQEKLVKGGVEIFVNSKVTKIEGKKISCLDGKGNERTLEVDHVVIAAGVVSENVLAESLKGKGFDVFAVGDCVSARRMINAVSEGAEVARKI